MKGSFVNKTVLLTGGRAAKEIYTIWKSNYPVSQLTNINFYFGDERCVPFSNSASNYGMTKSIFFSNGIPAGCNLFPMEGESKSPELAAREYAKLLPQKIDLIILSVGEDGHIASLFPGSNSLEEYELSVVAVMDPAGMNRLTITPKVIKNAVEVVVIAYGPAKRHLFEVAQLANSPENFPAHLVRNARWIVDDEPEFIAAQLWDKLKAK